MKRQAAIEQLSRALDEAIACAEQADMALVVLILDMARLEVDRMAESNVVTMPSSGSTGKRP
jgi:hypothetical protein